MGWKKEVPPTKGNRGNEPGFRNLGLLELVKVLEKRDADSSKKFILS